MEIQTSGGPDWAAFAPMIQAQQRVIAERFETALSGHENNLKETSESSTTTSSGERLSDSEQQVVDQLKARDKEVRDHEQAHARVGGQYAGEPSYEYQTGPDGKRYAVGGEVPIDVAPIPDDPEATITKMETVKAAALAPAEPSSADRQVAALADAQRAQALADLNALRSAARQGDVDFRA